MAMRWEDERYVRVYTRDTVDWLAFSFNAKALWMLLLRKADRAGIIDLGKRSRAAIGVVVGHPEMGDALQAALDELLADGCCELSPDGVRIIIPNYIEAQEATKSPAERQREYRRRARDDARAGLPPASQKGTVVYFIQSENGGAVKIGRADDLAKRLVGLQTGRPDKLIVLASAKGCRENEATLHRHLAKWRERGEWFSPSPEVLRAAALVRERGSEAWPVLDDELGDEMSPETSPMQKQVTSVTSPVTPSRAVPCRTEPSRAEPSVTKGAAAASPEDNAAAFRWIGWADSARSKALPNALQDPPGDPGRFLAWWREATGQVSQERLTAAYEAFLADDYARKMAPPCPWNLWAKNWRRYVPGQTAAPAKPQKAPLKVIPYGQEGSDAGAV